MAQFFNATCPICSDSDQVLHETDHADVIWGAGSSGAATKYGHVMVAPKRHVASLGELDENERIDTVRTVVMAMKASCGAWGTSSCNVGFNGGPASDDPMGPLGPHSHLHIHVVPRTPTDTNFMWWTTRSGILHIHDENIKEKTLLCFAALEAPLITPPSSFDNQLQTPSLGYPTNDPLSPPIRGLTSASGTSPEAKVSPNLSSNPNPTLSISPPTPTPTSLDSSPSSTSSSSPTPSSQTMSRVRSLGRLKSASQSNLQKIAEEPSSPPNLGGVPQVVQVRIPRGLSRQFSMFSLEDVAQSESAIPSFRFSTPPKEKCPLCTAKMGGLPERAEGRVIFSTKPYRLGHLIVIPARHIATLDECTDAEIITLFQLVEEAIEVLKEVTGCDSYNVGINVGVDSGASIPSHLHIHVVPRAPLDTAVPYWPAVVAKHNSPFAPQFVIDAYAKRSREGALGECHKEEE